MEAERSTAPGSERLHPAHPSVDAAQSETCSQDGELAATLAVPLGSASSAD